ncbi:MAG: MBL fold metallo-hydrolase [Bacillota bacterium]|jgi:flavorubredoxin|nr:MBL fold metallo-hydrolase [Bacillota bacterium]
MHTDRKTKNETLDYLQPIEIAEGVFWVGFADTNLRLRCNPYLIVGGDEAVLIDGGSRGDFSTVMMKILRTGVNPRMIKRLIYQHYDPDLCGNLPHLEAVINNKDLKIISHKENNIFIHFYSTASKKLCVEEMNFSYTFGNGRRLEFIMIPYAHCPGNFMTYDCKTKTLFSSDLFGSYDNIWELYLRNMDECFNCNPQDECHVRNRKCPIRGIISFHQRVMNSAASLRYALEQVETKDIALLAPQHGSLIDSPDVRKLISRHLKSLEHVGFDYYMHKKMQGKVK